MSTIYQQMSRSRILAAYAGDMLFELKKLKRTPAFAVPTLIFPAMFYVLFGVLMGGGRNSQFATYVLAGYSVFGAMAPGLYGFGVSLAFEREHGLLTLKQALPMPPAAYLLARMVNAMVFVTISTLLLLAVAVFLGHVPLTFGQALKLILVAVLGVLPFCAIGLFVGSLVSGQAAPAVVNLIYLPMAFLSGLWVPLQFLHKVIQQIAPVWPSHHLAQLALLSVGAPWSGSIAVHLAALLGVTLLFFTLAMRRLGNRGISLLGPSRARTSGMVPLRRAVNVGVIAVSIGLVISAAMANETKHTAVSAATPKDSPEGGAGSPEAAPASVAPVGVAAPATTALGDFDAGSMAVSYGLGWVAADDKWNGGTSTVELKLTTGGAANSKAALEVSGNVVGDSQYPFGGTAFFPNGNPASDFSQWGATDYSKRKALRFWARGDGQSYIVMILGPVQSAQPLTYNFTAGPEWREIRVGVSDLGPAYFERVKMISIGRSNTGPFRFEIDDVRIE